MYQHRRLENQHEDFRGSRWIEQLDGDLLTGCSLIYLRLEILEIKLTMVDVVVMVGNEWSNNAQSASHSGYPIRGIASCSGSARGLWDKENKGKGLGEGAPFYDNYACIQYHEVSRLMISVLDLSPLVCRMMRALIFSVEYHVWNIIIGIIFNLK